MSLKLVLVIVTVHCVAVTFAPPPPPPPPQGLVRRSLNRQEATTQQVCDDPCLLCGLVLISPERASSEQSAHTSMKETNLNQFMSAIQLLSGNIQHRSGEGYGKREAIMAKDSCLDICSLCYGSAVRQKRTVNSLAHTSAEQDCDDPCHLCELLLDYMDEELSSPTAQHVQQQSSNLQSKMKDFLSLARVQRPPIGKREAGTQSEDLCIDVCGKCYATKEKKAREQTVMNAILKMFLSK